MSLALIAHYLPALQAPEGGSVSTNELLHELVNSTQAVQALMVAFVALLVLLSIVGILAWSLRRGAKKDDADNHTQDTLINVIAESQIAQRAQQKQFNDMLQDNRAMIGAMQRNTGAIEQLVAQRDQLNAVSEKIAMLLERHDLPLMEALPYGAKNNEAISALNKVTTEGFDTMDTRLKEVETGLNGLRSDVLALKVAIESGRDHADQKADAMLAKVDGLLSEIHKVGTGSLAGLPATGSDADRSPPPASVEPPAAAPSSSPTEPK